MGVKPRSILAFFDSQTAKPPREFAKVRKAAVAARKEQATMRVNRVPARDQMVNREHAMAGDDRARAVARPMLTAQERQYLDLLKQQVSDGKVLAAMRLSRNQGLALTQSLRIKLGVGMAESLRDAARRLGL